MSDVTAKDPCACALSSVGTPVHHMLGFRLAVIAMGDLPLCNIGDWEAKHIARTSLMDDDFEIREECYPAALIRPL